jgi:carbamoyl-phosphate synthase large subunit
LDQAFLDLKNGDLEFPLIVKDRFGTGSVGQLFASNKDELFLAYKYIESRKNLKMLKCLDVNEDEPSTIIQEVLTGKEVGLQVVNDLNKKHIISVQMNIFSRWASETESVEIICNKDVLHLGERLSQLLGHVGVLDCDLFLNDRGLHVLDLNPRFGGQYPFAHEAGADLPKAFLNGFANYNPNINLGLKVTKAIKLSEKK